ncbi:PREDICTED: MLO-like protein 1 [Ipomoea nil]|uniref:MLO-like protein 1 n=1 Tax=Ipomoea nil TaxID=35883 RepID=UPI0009015483|nr:PREDICTED: MLO-like protein 1 [Ipomoea nil]
MAGGGEGEVTNLEQTPTWVVALVCTVIVAISLALERILHFLGKFLLKKKQKPLFEALQKIKEELMLLGFISLLMTVFQNSILKICISKHKADIWLPCKKSDDDDTHAAKGPPASTSHFQTAFTFVSSFLPPAGATRRLLSESRNAQYCPDKGKVPLLSIEALHHLHTFIFVLAVSHVLFSAFTMIFGSLKIRQWKAWEDSIQKQESNPDQAAASPNVVHVHEHDFVKARFLGFGKRTTLLSWFQSFFKQIFASVTRSDYTTLRLGFIMTHCRGNRTFNFYEYMIRALEADFKRVVGISWYLWVFVVAFLLLNVHGWHAYFWIAFIPLVLLLAVGTKLEHVITQLAEEVASKHVALEGGDLIVNPSDDHFWFHRPRLVLILIHIILFQNSFEIAFFFWIWVQYGFDSCIMGQVGYIIPRLVIGVFVQFLCSYSTLPLYAIVTQMGSSFKKAIFQEHIQEGLVGWAKKARRRAAFGPSQVAAGTRDSSPHHMAVEMAQVVGDGNGDEESSMSKAPEIKPANKD